MRLAHPFLSLFQLLNGTYLDRRFADHDAAAARIRDAYLAGFSTWAGRVELAHAFDTAQDVYAVAVAASGHRYPPAVAQVHPWMREMPAFCLYCPRLLVGVGNPKIKKHSALIPMLPTVGGQLQNASKTIPSCPPCAGNLVTAFSRHSSSRTVSATVVLLAAVVRSWGFSRHWP